MPGTEKTQIQITKKQHEKLEYIKEHLSDQASGEIGLTQASWEPTFADAVEHILQEYKHGNSLEQKWQREHGESDPETENDNSESESNDSPPPPPPDADQEELAQGEPEGATASEEEIEEFWS